MMDPKSFAIEDKKYSDLWQHDYKDANWRRLANAVLKQAESNGNNPLLIDFGFGRGTAMDFFESNGIYVAGVEISSHAVALQHKNGREVYHTSLDNLDMLKDNQFNIGFCNDVIEHVPEHLVEPSLEEMTRVCSDYLFISVCPTPSDHLSEEGENLHLTVRPESWWKQKLEKYGKVEKKKLLFSRSLRYVLDMKT
ncbi:MAG: methyltransferase domain-containing protein [Nanoarchaeota archaeon]|nr:methyltransferase domain-containing protein [Nanoarchaeota archaeon]